MQFYKGLIVNNADELNARRVQVRVLSIHPMHDDSNYNLVKDDCLPWARPAIPITAGKTSGMIGDFDVPDVDDWVWLFFEDDNFQRPVYFAIIATDVDVDDSFIPGGNKISNDKWGNTIIRDGANIKIIKNNGSIIDMNDDGINVITANGNTISLSDKEKKMTFKDVNGNIIETSENNIKCLNDQGNGIDIEKENINIISGSERQPAVYGVKLLEWLAGHTHTSSYPTSPTSTPLPDQLINLQDILHINTMYSDGTPFKIEPEDKDIVENREGEESVVYAPYVDQSYNNSSLDDLTADLIKKGIPEDEAKEKAAEQLNDNYVLENQQFTSSYAELVKFENLETVTTREFDKKYPILADPFNGDKIEEAKFNNKLKDFVPSLQGILIEARKRYRFVITEGFRTAEYQNKLFRKKLTPCDGLNKRSRHQGNGSPPITCVDVSPRPGGVSNTKAVEQLYEVMMSIAKFRNVRLKWLGTLRMPNGTFDKAHYELY